MDDQLEIETIMNNDDVLDMLDELLSEWDTKWWTDYCDGMNDNPTLQIDLPDENLVAYVNRDDITKGKALNIGCGNGRNSRYLAQRGYEVDAIDFYTQYITKAKTYEEDSSINYISKSVKDIQGQFDTYDFIYDSGCFHFVKPHRRAQYIKKMFNLLKPGGYLGLICYNESGGTQLTDIEVYHQKSMAAGLGYSESKLKKILIPYFDIIEFRTMKDGIEAQTYGTSDFWAILLHKCSHH